MGPRGEVPLTEPEEIAETSPLTRYETASRRFVDTDPETITLRAPESRDGAELWRLVRRSGGLEENSCYAYLLLSTHFASTCVVAESAGSIVGFVAGYISPSEPDAVFVWQIGVAPSVRRRGLGKRLLQRLISCRGARSARYLEATVASSNLPSRRLFDSFAAELGVACRESRGFEREDFGDASHEAEHLLRIGPLPESQECDESH